MIVDIPSIILNYRHLDKKKMKFFKLSQMNGLDKCLTKIYFSVQYDSYFSA